MITRRGIGLLVAAAGFLVLGRVFGAREMYGLAAITVVLCIAAVVLVAATPVRVGVERTIHPPRVAAGGPSRVELELRNRGTRRTPVLSVADPFDGGWRWARFLVPPVAPGERMRAAYRLPTDERGVFDVGPLQCTFADPFGIARRRVATVAPSQLTVYPRIDPVVPLPATEGQDPNSGARQASALLGAGDEFYALRQYEVGDDTRRVHWPSTARLGELMIRQDEVPWQTRATILLDVRASVHTQESLEVAVSAAASIHDASRRRQSLIRLVSTDGTDSGFAAGHAHADAILEHLATVDASDGDRLLGATAALRRVGNGGSLAVVTTDRATAADLDAVGRLRSRYGTLVVVLIAAPGPTLSPSKGPAATRAQSATPAGGGAIRLVRVGADLPFARSWNETLLHAAPRAARS